MEIAVAKICGVIFSHNFYIDGVIKNLNVEPIAASKQILSNFNILFKRLNNGFILLSRIENEGSSTPFVKLDKIGSLSFAVFIEDQFFIHRTNLPIDYESDEIYYLSNRANNLKNSQLLLSAATGSDYVSASDIIKLRTQFFTYHGSSASPTVTLEIKNMNDVTVINKNVQVVDGNYSYAVDLTGFANSRYKLFIDGVMKLDFFANNSLSNKRVIAVVEIFFSDSVSNNYMLTDSLQNISPKNYFINFDRRKTFWKYYVILKYRTSIAPGDLHIDHPDPSISFSQLTSQVLPNGDTAVPFVSNRGIDLKELAVTGIGLHSANGGSTNHINIENLPNASVANVVPDLIDDKIYSEIYVYI